MAAGAIDADECRSLQLEEYEVLEVRFCGPRYSANLFFPSLFIQITF